MTILMRNMLGISQSSSFSLTLSEESSYCSELSWDEDIDSDEDSSAYLSEEDDYLDAQMMKGDFFLEKPLEMHELDRMLHWGIGVKVKEAPPKFNDSIQHDLAMMPPRRKDSISDDRYLGSEGDFQRDMLGSSADIFSVISDEFNSNELADSLDDSFDFSDRQEYQSRSFTSLLGFEDADDDVPDTAPTMSNVPKNKASLIKQVACMASMVDEDASIADSHVIYTSTSEDRWAKDVSHKKRRSTGSRDGGLAQEKRNSGTSQDSRWTEGAPQEKPVSSNSRDRRWTTGATQEKRISGNSQDSRWTEGVAQEKRVSGNSQDSQWTEDLPQEKRNSDSTASRSAEGATMPPPRRRLSNVGEWNISKRHSLTSSEVDFEIFNQQMQAEVGLRMTDSLPAQKIMQAIMSVLKTQEGESKQEEMKPQRIVEGTRSRESMPRVQ